MKMPRERLFTGKTGHFTLEFYDRDEGGILGKAVGAVPLGGGPAWVAVRATATGATDDEVEQLLVEQLAARGE